MWLLTYTIPYDNVDVLESCLIEVQSSIKINEVAKVMIHIYCGVQLHQHSWFLNDFSTLVDGQPLWEHCSKNVKY